MRVLVVDDDEDVLNVVSLSLQARWPDSTVQCTADAATALSLFEQQPDVVILDLELPDGDGVDLRKRFRRQSQAGIVILSVRNRPQDIVEGLEAGADDYVTKPFHQPELVARVMAVLRRAEPAQLGHMAVCANGELVIDSAAREMRLRGQPVKLTATEYNLLNELAAGRRKCMTHRTPLARVWGPAYTDSVDSLKAYIQHLRRKLGDSPIEPRIIATEHGIGYKFIA